jgi:D-arabinose 5-phosphate isomerase GutQ
VTGVCHSWQVLTTAISQFASQHPELFENDFQRAIDKILVRLAPQKRDVFVHGIGFSG